MKKMGLYYKLMPSVAVHNFFLRICDFFHTSFFLKFMYYEPEICELFKKIKGETLIDVGANHGFYSIRFHEHFNNVIAVEPHPTNVQKLKDNLQKMRVKNITVIEKAVADKDNQTIPMFISSDHQLHTLVPPRKSTMTQPKHVPVETTTIASLLKDLQEASLIKVDVEGAEWMVLKGADAAMEKIKSWIIEVHNRNLPQLCPDRLNEMEELLQSYGYQTEWIDKFHIYGWHAPTSDTR